MVMEIYKQCFYGCGRDGTYKLKNGKFCCEKSHNKCPTNKKKNADAHIGVKRDPELMKQIGLKQRGKVFTEEHKRKLSEVWKGRKHTVETRKKQSDAAMGRVWSEESKEKLSKSLKGKFSGEENPNWCGGISKLPYCFEFTNDLKEFIKWRDGYTCQNESCTKKSNRLHIHHIDYNKQNCKPENLITLCNSCNSRANFSRDYWTGYYQQIISEVIYNECKI